MNYSVVCHGIHEFGLSLPPFALAEGDLMVVRTNLALHQAHCAALLLCEALCASIVIDGLEVVHPFVAVHPHLRAHVWGREFAEEIFRPQDRIRFLAEHMAIYALADKDLYNTSNNLKESLDDNNNVLFSFMALDGKSRYRVRNLLLDRPAHLTAIGIEGITENFSVEGFLPGATIVDWRGP